MMVPEQEKGKKNVRLPLKTDGEDTSTLILGVTFVDSAKTV